MDSIVCIVLISVNLVLTKINMLTKINVQLILILIYNYVNILCKNNNVQICQ